MSQKGSTASSKSRPSAYSTKSFTRFEPLPPASTPVPRNRATTLESSVLPRTSLEQDREDVFNKADQESDAEGSPELERSHTLPDKFDELPIELASLTDRFVDSLSTKAFDQPPSIEQISELFQEFYVRAATSVSIHISSLLTRLNRDTSPAPSINSAKSKTASRKSSHESLSRRTAESAQQMLTASEVTEKRKARKLLEYKRLVLEEAVERRACERVYQKLWRHKSTLDEVRDEKLRSKTAALALVGINLKDLGIELGDELGKTAEDVQQLLLPARDGLMKMNDEQHPLGKLQHLTKAHKAIVETLYAIQGSSSSADEVLPTLIFTLITSPVEGINIISNFNFIQRFRMASKIDGEAAYCLTNLEAAISFLENVDLSTLRADEPPEGPRKTPSQPGTPMLERSEPFPTMPMTSTPSEPTTATTPTVAPAEKAPLPKSPVASIKQLPNPRHQRTLSDIFQPVQASSEAVRIKANEGIENIANTLDNSFKFLFGRLREQAANPTSPTDVIVPKTLDEARQLVSRDPGPDEDGAVISETSSIAEREESSVLQKSKSDDKILSLFGGRKPASVRERSVDSQKSGTSARRVTFTQAGVPPDASVSVKETTPPASIISPASRPLDSVKNLGSSLNPFNTIGSAFGGGFARFGRPMVPLSTGLSSPTATDSKKDTVLAAVPTSDTEVKVSVASPDKVAAKIRTFPPPVKRFMQADSADDLRLKDIPELLREYQRLAGILNELASGEGSNAPAK